MKNGRRFLIWIAAALTALCMVCGAMAEVGTIFPWLDYTMDVVLFTDDPELVDVRDVPSGGTTVLVKLVPLYGKVRYDDISRDAQQFALRAGNGKEFGLTMFRVRGVKLDSNMNFSTDEEQDAFELLFFLDGMDGSAMAGAKLIVPGEKANEKIIVPLDGAPRAMPGSGGAAKPAEAGETAETGNEDAQGMTFVLGGVAYTVSETDDAPSYAPKNLMDGREGHRLVFTYPVHGKEAEEANKKLYSGAKVRQPDGEEIPPYCNADNIGNPYVLYFGLSDGVMLKDCVLKVKADNGTVEIPLAPLGVDAAEPETAEEPAEEEPAEEPTEEEPAEEPAEAEEKQERADNAFAYTVGGETYEFAFVDASYNKEDKQLDVDVIIYDHDIMDFIHDGKMEFPVGCGITSTKDGFIYTEGTTATIATPMHMIFHFDTKNVPDLVCIGRLNTDKYADSEDFALIDPSNKQFVSTFPITALLGGDGDPDSLLESLSEEAPETPAEEPGKKTDSLWNVPQPKPKATEEPAKDPEPAGENMPDETASDEEKEIFRVCGECAEAAGDEWQRAIFMAGVKKFEADPKKEDTYSFRMRGFDPGLKDLGKYKGDNKKGYLAGMLKNAGKYNLSVTVTMKDGKITEKSLKSLKSAVKKAADASQKAFKDSATAISEGMFYLGFGKDIKKGDDLTATDEFKDWFKEHKEVFPDKTAKHWVAFMYGQVKQTLDVSGGPNNMVLSCSMVYPPSLLTVAEPKAVSLINYYEPDERETEDRQDREMVRALANAAVTLKKDKNSYMTVDIRLNVDGESFWGDTYTDLLNSFTYEDTMYTFRNDLDGLPPYARVKFPKTGRLSGSNSGSKLNIKAPKDSAAYYVQLRKASNDQVVVSGFVQPGSTCSLRLPSDEYYAVMASGDMWFGEEHLFGDDTKYQKTASFRIKGSNYVCTLTLEVKRGGNLSLYGADEDDLKD